MMVMRAFLGGLLLCGLVACDSDQSPQPKAPASEPAEAVLPAPVEPAPPVPAAAPAPAPQPAPEPPVPESEPQGQPAPPQKSSQVPSAPRPADSARAAAASRPVAPLDLSLPSEVLERFKLPDEVPVEALEPPALLPPLFVDKATEPDSFELGGKLITSERPVADEDSWHSVEGVELQLQFRR
ncbi:hypothetical protein SAMN05216229_103345 [Geopseudomonas sagittaria]|uniref:Translation initiation factor IF-2 n=1 Tax=Geopseudomonas sagittaria TaxID=1135990 RepID=A0A1I5RIR0_9GAMM|nr:hypothetical protein SAMN05216229_103345 [Pseudomonas sagittaria]